MCDSEQYIDVEWSPLVEEPKEKENWGEHDMGGEWDIVASFAMNDEVILEQMMDLDIAKIMIIDYYASLYAHKAQLSIRRRMRPFKTSHDRCAEKRAAELGRIETGAQTLLERMSEGVRVTLKGGSCDA